MHSDASRSFAKLTRRRESERTGERCNSAMRTLEDLLHEVARVSEGEIVEDERENVLVA